MSHPLEATIQPPTPGAPPLPTNSSTTPNATEAEPLAAIRSIYVQTIIDGVPAGKINFGARDNVPLARAAIVNFPKRENPPASPEYFGDMLALLFGDDDEAKDRQTKRLLIEVGCTNPEEGAKLLSLQHNIARFEAHLASKNNPRTGKPFIEIKRRERASDAFDDLLESASTQGNNIGEVA